jgi:hypothetical protein
MTNLEIFGKIVDITSIFVVSESVPPQVAHLFLESCPVFEVGNMSSSLLPLDAFDALLELLD